MTTKIYILEIIFLPTSHQYSIFYASFVIWFKNRRTVISGNVFQQINSHYSYDQLFTLKIQ